MLSKNLFGYRAKRKQIHESNINYEEKLYDMMRESDTHITNNKVKSAMSLISEFWIFSKKEQTPCTIAKEICDGTKEYKRMALNAYADNDKKYFSIPKELIKAISTMPNNILITYDGYDIKLDKLIPLKKIIEAVEDLNDTKIALENYIKTKNRTKIEDIYYTSYSEMCGKIRCKLLGLKYVKDEDQSIMFYTDSETYGQMCFDYFMGNQGIRTAKKKDLVESVNIINDRAKIVKVFSNYLDTIISGLNRLTKNENLTDSQIEETVGRDEYLTKLSIAAKLNVMNRIIATVVSINIYMNNYFNALNRELFVRAFLIDYANQKFFSKMRSGSKDLNAQNISEKIKNIGTNLYNSIFNFEKEFYKINKLTESQFLANFKDKVLNEAMKQESKNVKQIDSFYAPYVKDFLKEIIRDLHTTYTYDYYTHNLPKNVKDNVDSYILAGLVELIPSITTFEKVKNPSNPLYIKAAMNLVRPAVSKASIHAENMRKAPLIEESSLFNGLNNSYEALHLTELKENNYKYSGVKVDNAIALIEQKRNSNTVEQLLIESIGESIKNGFAKFIQAIKNMFNKFVAFFSKEKATNTSKIKRCQAAVLAGYEKIDTEITLPNYEAGITRMQNANIKKYDELESQFKEADPSKVPEIIGKSIDSSYDASKGDLKEYFTKYFQGEDSEPIKTQIKNLKMKEIFNYMTTIDDQIINKTQQELNSISTSNVKINEAVDLLLENSKSRKRKRQKKEQSAPDPAPANGQSAPAPAPANGQSAPAPAPANGQSAPAPAPANGQSAPDPAPANGQSAPKKSTKKIPYATDSAGYKKIMKQYYTLGSEEYTKTHGDIDKVRQNYVDEYNKKYFKNRQEQLKPAPTNVPPISQRQNNSRPKNGGVKIEGNARTNNGEANKNNLPPKTGEENKDPQQNNGEENKDPQQNNGEENKDPQQNNGEENKEENTADDAATKQAYLSAYGAATGKIFNAKLNASASVYVNYLKIIKYICEKINFDFDTSEQKSGEATNTNQQPAASQSEQPAQQQQPAPAQNTQQTTQTQQPAPAQPTQQPATQQQQATQPAQNTQQ